MTTTQIKVTKKKASATATKARVVEMSVKRVKRDTREPAAGAVPAPAAKARAAVVKTPARRGRSS